MLLVNNITPSNNPHSKNIIIELSDGAYSMPVLVVADSPVNGKEERFDCDVTLIKMI